MYSLTGLGTENGTVNTNTTGKLAKDNLHKKKWQVLFTSITPVFKNLPRKKCGTTGIGFLKSSPGQNQVMLNKIRD
jgi:hypothetical protein